MSDPDKRAAYSSEDMVTSALDTAEKTGVRTYDFYGSKIELPIERKFGDLPSIQAYCNAVLALSQVRAKYPKVTPITVRRRKGDKFAHYQMGEIAINDSGRRWAMREMIVLHELAHHLERDGHGPKWRAAFVFLVNECIGPEVGMILGASFHQNIVK